MDRAALERPFPPELVKTRKGPFGDVSYVEGVHYTKRLNEAFDGQWDFVVVQHEVRGGEVVVLGKLTAGGVTKMAFGGSTVTTSRQTGEVMGLADDLKAAATDALKKAASLFGIGLDLYSAATEKAPMVEAPKPPARALQSVPPDRSSTGVEKDAGSDASDRSRLTAKQLKAIYAIGHAHGLGEDDLRQQTLQAYGVAPQYLTRADASAFITSLTGR